VLDVGFIGLGLWIWLFVRSIRLLLRRTRESSDGDDWLFLGLAGSILALGVGMLTFDAFSFTQVPFIFWILLGLVAALVSEPSRPALVTSPARLRTATN